MMRTIAFATAAVCALAACAPSAPAPSAPVRNVDFRVTTTPSIADRRFLVEFASLSDRELCLSANDWPTPQGQLGHNRGPEAGDAVRRVRSRETISAFVRFDQVEPAQRLGEGARQVDFSPEPVFCAAVLQ
jgi:hypothetical protein